MSRPAKPADSPWVTPYITVRNVDAAAEFLEHAFGFQRVGEALKGPDGRSVHLHLRYREGAVMLGLEGAWGATTVSPKSSGVPGPIGLYVYCDDVDAMFERASKAGAKIEMPLTDAFWGDRIFACRDPDGHGWTFGTNVGEFDASKIPTMQCGSK